MKHEIEIQPTTDRRFVGICTGCYWHSDPQGSADEALLKSRIHDANHYRAQLALRRTVTNRAVMLRDAKWYREQAENPNIDPRQRGLWEQLARELERHLGLGAEPVQESGLW